jgi:site-specific recombinase XerD
MSLFPRPFAPDNGRVPETKALTVAEAIDLFLNHEAKRQARCLETAREREKLLREFCASFGTRLLTDCCAGNLQFWCDSHESWRSEWTITKVLRTIERPFNWLVKLGVIPRNPFAGLHHPKGERGRPMEDHEFRLFLRSTDACFRRVLIFLRYVGCRPGELRALEWEMIKIDQATAIIQRHKTRHSRRDRAPRILVLHPVATKLLVWIKRHSPEGQVRVFVNSRGRPWTKSALDLRIARMRKRLGIDESCVLYGIRHSWATSLALGGVDLATLAELLGHTGIQMATHYVHVAAAGKDHLRKAVLKAFPGK